MEMLLPLLYTLLAVDNTSRKDVLVYFIYVEVSGSISLDGHTILPFSMQHYNVELLTDISIETILF